MRNLIFQKSRGLRGLHRNKYSEVLIWKNLYTASQFIIDSKNLVFLVQLETVGGFSEHFTQYQCVLDFLKS